MKISDSYAFDAKQDIVWNLLMDPQAIANALPGVDRLIPVDGELQTWRATAKIGVASVSGMYTGLVRMSEMEPPHQYRLTVSGEGQQSIIGGTALLKLSYDEMLHQTRLDWDADAHVSGKLASVGQRLVGAAAKLLGKQFFRALANQLPADSRT
jgi:carbon monoxide dehydrogenase subunit G